MSRFMLSVLCGLLLFMFCISDHQDHQRYPKWRYYKRYTKSKADDFRAGPLKVGLRVKASDPMPARDQDIERKQRYLNRFNHVNAVNKADITTLSEEACFDNAVITCPKGTVTSLGYPRSYPGNLTCKWTIKAAKGQVVRLYFSDFSLENGDCISVSYRGSPVQHLYNPAVVLCGEVDSRKITSVGHVVDVTMTSGKGIGRRGMMFHYSVKDPVECDDIIEIEADHGNITSPGYPNNYQANTKCLWRIITPGNTTIRIAFTDLAIEYARSCDYDDITVYDGPLMSDARLASHCGYTKPNDVITSGNVALVTFVSDTSDEDRGFAITWEVAEQ